MKDKLGREIMVGDTLAYAQGSKIVTAVVKDMAAFAILFVGDTVMPANAETYVICDWTK